MWISRDDGDAVGDDVSTLAQSFNVTGGNLDFVRASVSFYIDEHPSHPAGFNDTWQITARSPGQTGTTLLKQEARTDVFTPGNTTVNTATAPASGGGVTPHRPGAYRLPRLPAPPLPRRPTPPRAGQLGVKDLDVGDP